jgi:hypothetical protein
VSSVQFLGVPGELEDVGALDELEVGAVDVFDELGAVGELVEFVAPDVFGAPGVVTELLELPVPLGRLVEFGLVELGELTDELFGAPLVGLVELFD